ncbi:MAG: hypothetical protein IT306_12360 [Chloroflexi bacterium]|nr:hypothetical protein [Chloroflexota bacterium]
MTSAIAPQETSASAGAASASAATPAAVAARIHDDILQSLGVAVLGVDLGRRLHERMRYEQALSELEGIVAALELAIASTERLLPELLAILPASPAPATARPSLRVMALDADADDIPTAGPEEIVTTISACLVQARRCRGQYDAGLGEETMRDLELLLQRLEFVSVAFRAVMSQLRELAATPAPITRPRIVSLVRSA